MTAHVPLSRLCREELRALPRGRFALAGAAVLASALALLALIVAPAQQGLWAFSIIAYGIGPALLAAFSAAQLAGLRASRFTHSLYTAPVRPLQVLAAKTLVGLSAAALYFAATLPFLAVGAAHVELSDGVQRFAAAGALMLVFAVALGTFLGVVLTGRSVAAPVALAAGFVVVSVFAMPYAAGLLSTLGSAPDEATMRALHLSPHLLVSDGVELLEADAGRTVASPPRALALFALEVVGLLTGAAWIYARQQGVDGWEAGPARRAAAIGLVALALVVPTALADATYVASEDVPRESRFSMAEAKGALILLPPEGESHADRFGDFTAATWDTPLLVERSNERELYVLLDAPRGASLSDVRVHVEAEPRLVVESQPQIRVGDVLAPERARAQGMTPIRVPFEEGAVVHADVRLRPTDALDLTTNFYLIHVNVSYTLDGELREANASISLRADIPGIRAQMAAAGAPLPLLATIAAVARRVRAG